MLEKCKLKSSIGPGKITNKQGCSGGFPTRPNKCQKYAGMAVPSVWHAALNTQATIFMDNQGTIER